MVLEQEIVWNVLGEALMFAVRGQRFDVERDRKPVGVRLFSEATLACRRKALARKGHAEETEGKETEAHCQRRRRGTESGGSF